MKAALYFDMNGEDKQFQEREFKLACRASDWALVVWEIDTKLRNWLKHGHEWKTADMALEETRTFLWNTLDCYGLNLDDAS